MGKKITIVVEDDLLAKIDACATASNCFRSVWIMEAARDRLEGKTAEPVPNKALRFNYSAAVSAARRASNGKLSQIDAESIAAEIIVAMSRGDG
jgi:metal-responsive CopG/Arc/MetJ family transcriptional regulator